MPAYETPGVYIEEVTGPGVIAGVGTSTAAIVGPALRGPIREAVRVTSYDEFLERFAIQQSDGSYWPHITSPQWAYTSLAVQGFFENGGRRAYVVRVANGESATWAARNRVSPVSSAQALFRVQARDEGTAPNTFTIDTEATNATTAAGVALATGAAGVVSITDQQVVVDAPDSFRVGDIVTKDESTRATVTAIQGDVLTLSTVVPGLQPTDTLRIANIRTDQRTFRVTSATTLAAGTVAQLKGRLPGAATTTQEYVVIDSVDAVGFVTLAASPARTRAVDMSAAAPVLVSHEFRLIVSNSGATEVFDNLSLSPIHPRYVFTAVNSALVRILPPLTPPTTATYPQRLVRAEALARVVDGREDDPATLALEDYRKALAVLRQVDDVSIVCVPDAAAHPECITIQKAVIDHCVQLKDRVAVLDSRPNAEQAGVGGVEDHRSNVQSERGFAALYYPWLLVPEPIKPPSRRPPVPRRLAIPPSGHVAGLYARIDGERGVHKAPANADLRGVVGLERRLSDEQQAPLNLQGINVLRMFPGSGQVTVWGARTTVDPNITDWIYVSTRRLMVYIEESIEEGIRSAVFEPNNPALWKKLKRTIAEFLSRVWRDGALDGETAEQAYFVRIDEGINPPSTRALGRLYIEIGVRPSYPAEFIIVRIGLWAGGAEVIER